MKTVNDIPKKMKIIKGICQASAISKRDSIFSVPPSDYKRAVVYGLTMSGRLIAAFDGEAEAEFIIPGGSTRFVSEIGGKLSPNPYMERDGLWLGGPLVVALQDIAKKAAPQITHSNETAGQISYTPSFWTGVLKTLVDAANGPAWIE